MEICFCGREKAEDRLTCPKCFELYRKETRGKTDLIDWVKRHCLKMLEKLGTSKENPETDLERRLEAKKAELREFKNSIAGELSLVVQQRLAGAGKLRDDELQAFQEDVRKELWIERGGNKLYGELKALEQAVATEVFPIRETLKQITKTKGEHASVERFINAVLPEQ